MINKRSFVLLSVVIFIMVILFQLIQLNMVWNNSWVKNGESKDFDIPSSNSSEMEAGSLKSVEPTAENPVRYYIISNDAEEMTASNTIKTLSLLKFPFLVYSSLDELPQEIDENLYAILIAEANLDNIGDINTLYKYSEKGVDTVFLTLFDTTSSVFKKNKLNFGIESVGERYFQEKIDFLKDVLVSDIMFEAKISTNANRVRINGKCRFYSVGYKKNEEHYYNRNPIIWRTYYGKGAIYVMNNDLLKDFKNSGVLIGVLSMDKEYFVYPIINAGFLSVDGFPYFSTENNENLLKAYNRNAVQFQRDVVWSDLISISKNLNITYTFFPYVGTDSGSIEDELLGYYGRQLTMNNCEIAYYPSSRFRALFPNYEIKTEYSYPSSKTIGKVTPGTSDFGYADNSKINLPIISEGPSLSSGDIFKAFSMASGYGYVSHSLDIKDVIMSDSQNDIWSKYKVEYVESVYPITKTYEYIEFCNASKVAEKMAIYLNNVPVVNKVDNKVIIEAQDIGETSYIFKSLTEEVVSFENCTVKEAGDRTYIVVVGKGKKAIIKTKPIEN